MVIHAEGEQAVAELLVWDEVLGYGLEVEERCGIGGCIVVRGFVRAWDNAVGWNLVEDA